MVWTTLLFGVILTAIGMGGYYGVEQASWTAMIPAALGVPLLISGLLALKPAFRQNAMRAAVFMTLLGLVGTAHSLLQLAQLVLREPGLVTGSVTAVLCGMFLWISLKAFLEARRRRPDPKPSPVAPVSESAGKDAEA